jgi:hypothetical protein
MRFLALAEKQNHFVNVLEEKLSGVQQKVFSVVQLIEEVHPDRARTT